MRVLLTSAGIKNSSIHDALVDLLGIRVVDGVVQVVSEGHWKLFRPAT